MRTVVILQPQYLPWRGVFEQIRLAEVFVHFDDVQFPQGRSFTSRVQVKTASGSRWLSVPVRRDGRVSIAQTRIDESQDWRSAHLRSLEHAYARASHAPEMLALARTVIDPPCETIAELNMAATERLAATLRLSPRFARSSATPSGLSATARLVELCKLYEAERYVTGHGALAYLEIDRFRREGIAVDVMDYRLTPYPQLHGDFIPYVTILDLIANVGVAEAPKHLDPATRAWEEIAV